MSDDERKQRRKKSKKKKKKEKRGYRSPQDRPKEWTEKTIQLRKMILALPGNLECAECANKYPDWSSINLGVMICTECAGIHRGLGVHISKVRSIEMDVWPEAQLIRFYKLGGNTKVNGTWEATLKKDHKPNSSDRRTIQHFIQMKYQEKRFLAREKKDTDDEDDSDLSGESVDEDEEAAEREKRRRKKEKKRKKKMRRMMKAAKKRAREEESSDEEEEDEPEEPELKLEPKPSLKPKPEQIITNGVKSHLVTPTNLATERKTNGISFSPGFLSFLNAENGSKDGNSLSNLSEEDMLNDFFSEASTTDKQAANDMDALFR
ncbi:hypothetical protein AAMO2058_000048000 [Amorphochlora amoebiformis]|uniref:Arf-GAP domain-containing protein n=1 Tax=Amorphochlora amoebiformis TaxID=1561963 RepID=A0A7S0CV43_9EUKA